MKRRQSSYPLRRRKRNPNRSHPIRFPLLHCEPLEERRLLAVLTVNSELDNLIPDDGLVTLREAIIAANSNATTDLRQTATGGDQIVFDSSLDGKPITLAIPGTGEDAARTGDLDITHGWGLTITGNGASQTIIDAQSIDRVFDIKRSSTGVTLENMTITGGAADGSGGAIRTLNLDELTISGSTISGNSAGERGGGIFATGYGFTVANSTISGNSADIGGGIFAVRDVTVENTTISENSASSDGGIHADGNVMVASSAVWGNSSRAGSSSFGAGGISASGEVTIENSTISENRGGGYGGPGGIKASRDVKVTNSTMSGNVGGHGDTGGIITDGTLTLNSSIVAGNVWFNYITPRAAEFRAAAIIAANSLIRDNNHTGLAAAQTPDANGNLIGTTASPIDPLLGPLQHNGGLMLTHALLPGSPAINMGDPSFQDRPDHDQRGALFARVSAGRIDVGAFETQIAPVDFNDDDLLDCADIDALMAAIFDRNNPPAFDLTGDTVVRQADLDVWLSLAGLENLPLHEAYLPGDANLDGNVDAQDLNVVAINWRQNVTGWCSGDFTVDGAVDARDLNELGLNWHQDLPDEAAAARQRARRAALAQNVVVTTTGRFDLDASVQSASQIIERIQPEDIGEIPGKNLDQIMRRRSRRYAVSSESRPPSAHHEKHELSLIDQFVDSVLKDWKSK